MRYDRLFLKLYCRPVLIQTAAFIGLETALLNHVTSYGATGEKQMGKLRPAQKQNRLDNVTERVSLDTLLIHMDGVIDKHISQFEMDCYSGFDLRDFDSALAAAAQDPEIQNVMLVINSPGGSVTGVPESAARVAELAATKNVFAFTEGLCCSAAYYIASQADQVYGTASSDVGSIGVYMALLDATRALDKKGVSVNFIKDGKFKGMGAPFKALTDDERSMFQAEVDKIGAMFRAAVNAKRPDVSIDTMQGQSFFGDNALDAGLVDGIVSGLGAALAQF
jgi:signal peptide peptidase SppA